MTQNAIEVIDSTELSGLNDDETLGRYIVRLERQVADARTSYELLRAHALAEAVAHLTKIKKAGREVQASAIALILSAEAKLVAIADRMKEDREFRGRGRPPVKSPQPQRERANYSSDDDLSYREAVQLNHNRIVDARALNEAGGAAAIEAAAAKVAENPETPITRKAIVLTAKNGSAPLVNGEGDEARKRWRKWFWSDWRSDVRLRMCSLAARGLWAELLAIMDQGNPVGYLVDESGRPLTIRQIATQSAAPGGEVEVRKLMQELETAGVFSRNSANVIYSRRVIRDEEKSRKQRENGSLGGNPDLLQNQRDTEGGVNPQRPETRDQSIIHTESGAIPGEVSGKDLLGAPLAETQDARYSLTPTTPIPEPWIGEAIKRAGMSAAEAQAEWADGFVTYWAQRAGIKDGRKTTENWKATWVNYITGSIAQSRIAARRRAGRNQPSGAGGRAEAPAGKVDIIRNALANAEAYDRAGGMSD